YAETSAELRTSTFDLRTSSLPGRAILHGFFRGLVDFFRRQQRRCRCADETTGIDRQGHSSSAHIVRRIDNHEHILVAEGKVERFPPPAKGGGHLLDRLSTTRPALPQKAFDTLRLVVGLDQILRHRLTPL